MLVKQFNTDGIHLRNHMKMITWVETYSGMYNKNKYYHINISFICS
jgi:hypothetical protein